MALRQGKKCYEAQKMTPSASQKHTGMPSTCRCGWLAPLLLDDQRAPHWHSPEHHLQDLGGLFAASCGDETLQDQGGPPYPSGNAEHGLLGNPGRP